MGKTEKMIIQQHIADVNNTINNIKNMKCNITLNSKQNWEEIKSIRLDHCESYLKILKDQESN